MDAKQTQVGPVENHLPVELHADLSITAFERDLDRQTATPEDRTETPPNFDLRGFLDLEEAQGGSSDELTGVARAKDPDPETVLVPMR